MARAIDADSLRTSILQFMAENAYLGMSALDVLKILAQWTDEAQTLDVAFVKRGVWHVTKACPHRLYCGECYATNIANVENPPNRGCEQPKFCMYCGAKLEGCGENENHP